MAIAILNDLKKKTQLLLGRSQIQKTPTKHKYITLFGW